MSTQKTVIEKLTEERCEQLTTLAETADKSTEQTFQAFSISSNLLHKLVEDVQHVKYQMWNLPPIGALDPTKDLPVMLEDSLGHILAVPMDWIKTWEVGHLTIQRGCIPDRLG